MSTSWTTQGRPALLQALAVCDQIDANLSAERREKDAEQDAALAKELEQLRSQCAHVERLEQENKSLREEIGRLQTQSGAVKARSDAQGALDRVPLAHLSPNKRKRKPSSNESHAVQGKCPSCTKLLTDLGKLVRKCEKYEGHFETLKETARKRKEDVVKWVKYNEYLETKIKKLECRYSHRLGDGRSSLSPGRTTTILDGECSVAAIDSDLVQPPEKPSLSASFASDAAAERPSEVATPAHEEQLPLIRVPPVSGTVAIPAEQIVEAPRSDSTQGDPWEQELPRVQPADIVDDGIVVIKEEPSDSPIIVSARPVRKRKHLGCEASPVPRRIKVEDRGSDPVITAEMLDSPHESIDLDADHQTLVTPKKHRRSLPSIDENQLERYENELGRGVSDPPRSLSIVSVSAMKQLGRVQPDRHITQDSTKGRDQLQERAGLSTSRRRDRHLDDGIADLADDECAPVARVGDRDRIGSRLGPLLDSPSPATRPLLRRQTRGAKVTACLEPSRDDVPTPRVLPFDAASKETHCEAPTSTRSKKMTDHLPAVRSTVERTGIEGTVAPRASARKPSKPLRDMPVGRLTLDDFKINPKHNDGQSFAFTEVVRSREDRENLAGCTDPNCCGKHFWAMALSELEHAGFATTQNSVSVKLLEEFLGDEAYRLGSVDKREREQLWLQARARELANRFGKHRHRFFRRPSPPGFWTADFPSTQEDEENRREAERLERMVVEDRYREARRRGGRWLFRDE